MSKVTFMKKLTSICAVTTGAGVFFSALNIYKNNEKFYENILMPIVRMLPPETSHNMAVFACKYNLFPKSVIKDPECLNIEFLGKNLKNPIGIAAGFDKNGEAIEGLNRIGFGFVEVGSVTPLPQSGNPKPRIFRLPLDKAIINRYGFNSEGHEIVYKRLKVLQEKNNSKEILLGINLGKNKNSDNAISDYTKGVQLFSSIADYLVINVSSPNTPGLRNLQNKDDLGNLLSAVISTRENLPVKDRKPILLKLSPDLVKQDRIDIANVIKKKNCKIDGLIISNTTIDRSNLLHSQLAAEIGGLSGAPIKDKSTQLIADMYSLTNGKIPIIGVGGMFTGQDVFEKIQAGASVVQIYTAFAYHGPPIVNKIKTELKEILKKNNFKNISEVVGKKYNFYKN